METGMNDYKAAKREMSRNFKLIYNEGRRGKGEDEAAMEGDTLLRKMIRGSKTIMGVNGDRNGE